jgi:hypothetical protein
VIVVEPTDEKVKEGSNVIFMCKSSGVPSPTITWLFNGQAIPWGHSIEKAGSLFLTSVRHGTHNGRYTCVATSKAGNVAISAWLFVYGKNIDIYVHKHIHVLVRKQPRLRDFQILCDEAILIK